jgi:hypothetical protein
VKPGEPVVAIVRRYDALLGAAPSDADLANLPYAHVENAMALRPFALLSQTTGFPGAALSDRGLLPSNALLVDAGVPSYDAVLGVSPYLTIPANYERSGDILPPSDAFAYGDQAGSGIVTLTPFAGDDADLALLGGDTIARFAAGSGGTGIVAGSYSNFEESRQRADAEVTLPLSTAQSLVLSGGTSQGREFASSSGNSLEDAFGFARAAFDDLQPDADLHASFVADRGDYTADSYYGSLSDVWSDVSFDAGIRSRGEVAGFLDLSSRLSTGTFGSQYSPFGAAMTQDRIDAGIDADTPFLDATAGVGIFGVGFSGGGAGASGVSYGHLATPSIDLNVFPDGKWSADVSASDSFDLPTLWQQYAWDANYQGLTYDRASLYDATLTYTDDARLRLSAQAASQRVRGFTDGLVTSDGFSVAWQVAPQISLRAWTMFVDDATWPTAQAPGYPGIAPTVDAFWLTYDNGGAMRVDAIYRRDLLDNSPFYHFDGDVSGPVGPRLRWYAGVEDRQRTQFIDVGLRFSK